MKTIYVMCVCVVFGFTTSCTKELQSVSATNEANAAITIAPFLEKTTINLTGIFKDSCLAQMPADYYTTKTKYPLLIFFHGTGEAVNDGGLNKLMKLGPPKYMRDSVRIGNFITLCPQDQDGYRTAINVDEVVNAAVKKYRVDTSRIYLTGLSAGARNIMNYITEKPEYAKKIAAVVPMSIIYMDQSHLDNMGNFATYNVHCKIFCGDNDLRYYPYNVQYKNMINTYKPIECEFITYVGAHSGWNKPYKPTARNNNVYTWLLNYKRS